MGNVTLPTPVFVAGGAACLLAGFLVGSVLAPDAPDNSIATVSSYTPTKSQLCLSGDSVKDETGVNADGELCGTWRRTPGVGSPRKGQKFRFVAVSTSGSVDGQSKHQTVIYGDVVQ